MKRMSNARVLKATQRAKSKKSLNLRVPWVLWVMFIALVLWLIYQNIPRSEKVPTRRRCVTPWRVIGRDSEFKICITTLSDANRESVFSRSARRDFSTVLSSTWNNKQNYAEKYGYHLFNASALVDVNRPPAWSKILAVQDALQTGCDWVFWMDPDSLIMNAQIRLEQILPSAESADLVITKDVTGYNAGMWMVRNSDWTNQFLQTWWSMENFIRRPGDTKSGDNDALKELLEHVDGAHVYVAQQCLFNSYLWTPGLKSWSRYAWDKKRITDGIYLEGDFVLHFAGIDDKMGLIKEYEKMAH